MIGSVRKDLKKALPSFIILAAMFTIVCCISPTFRSTANLQNIIAQTAVLAMLAIAQSQVLLIGGIDMSVSSVISFTTIMMALYSGDTVFGIVFAMILAITMGVVVGCVNGLGVVKFKIPAMIITISTQAFLKGICLIIMPSSGGLVNTEFASFLKTKIGIFNVSFIITLLLYVFMFVLLHYSRFGRRIYAIGNNETYAEQSGIQTKKTIVLVYAMVGAIAAISGVLLSARIAVGNPLVGDSYAMDSVAAAVVGGISMNGGTGSVIGALFGAIILSLINNIINTLGISPYYQYIVKGVILVGSLMLFQLKRRKKA